MFHGYHGPGYYEYRAMDTDYPYPGLDCRTRINAVRADNTHIFTRDKESTAMPGLPQDLEVPAPNRTCQLKTIKVCLGRLPGSVLIIGARINTDKFNQVADPEYVNFIKCKSCLLTYCQQFQVHAVGFAVAWLSITFCLHEKSRRRLPP